MDVFCNGNYSSPPNFVLQLWSVQDMFIRSNYLTVHFLYDNVVAAEAEWREGCTLSHARRNQPRL